MSGTSWKVKNRYNKKHYKRIVVDLDSELVDAFKEKCKEQDIKQAEVIRNAIKDWLKERD